MSPAAQAWAEFHRRGFWLFLGRPCPHCPCFVRDERSAAWGFVCLVRTRDPIGAIHRTLAA